MGLRRTSHAVYDSQYPLVWAPKYRKWILRGDLRAYVGKLFHRIKKEVAGTASRFSSGRRIAGSGAWAIYFAGVVPQILIESPPSPGGAGM